MDQSRKTVGKSNRRRAMGFERLEDRWLLSGEAAGVAVSPSLAGGSLAFPVDSAPAIAASPDYSVTAIQGLPAATNTGEKPQSKVWYYDHQWWSVLADSAGTAVFRLDSTNWTRVLNLTTGLYRADVRENGGVVHVLLEKGVVSRLASIEYVPGAPGTYRLWSVRPTLTNVPLSTGVRTATLDIDSIGRLWVGSNATYDVEVRYSDYPYKSLSAPIILASGIRNDDSCAVRALPGKIGVLWSNQNMQRFGFRYHVDGDSPETWSVDEVPASPSALEVGGGMADDHVNLAAASDGTLYAAVKTSYDLDGFPAIALLVRRPSGAWDPLYPVDLTSGTHKGTRGIVLLNEATERVLVAYRNADDAGPIVYRESPTDTIAFGAEQVLIDDPTASNVSSTRQNWTSEFVAIAADANRVVRGAVLRLLGNTPPTVSAGADQAVVLPASVELGGRVVDDGLPDPPAVTVRWTQVSGPGTVTFADPSAASTTARFSRAGTYVLRLAANDGQYSNSDDLTITAQPGTATRWFQDGISPGSSYAGARDTMIVRSSPAANYGASTTLSVDGAAATLLRWDLSAIKPGSQVQSVSLTVRVTNASVQSYRIYEMERDWEEGAATWRTYASGNNWELAGAQGPSDRGSAVLGTLAASATGQATAMLNAAGLALVQSWIDRRTPNYGFVLQDYTNADALRFNSRETATSASRPRLSVQFVPNLAPVVNAGPDQTIALPALALLTGTVMDDGMPKSAGSAAAAWSVVSGPGTVTFGNASQASTTASFSQPGTYTLRLTGNDGSLSASDKAVITVRPAPPNRAPIVDAGPDQTITLPATASLAGQVTDDSLPDPPRKVALAWSVTSGPGTVTFASPTQAITTATFSLPGTYVLRLTANDGALIAWDEVVVTATAGAPVSFSFQAGAAPTAAYASMTDAKLSASAPTVNYGSGSTLVAMGGAWASGVLLRWDLRSIPAGVVVQSASLTLQVTNITAQTYQLYALKRNWVESQVTWQNASTGSGWEIAGAQGPADRDPTVLGTLTVNALGTAAFALNAAGVARVQAWINNPVSNFGFVLQNYGNTDALSFSSSEATMISQRPALGVVCVWGPPLAAGGLASAIANLSPAPALTMADDAFLRSQWIAFQAATFKRTRGESDPQNRPGAVDWVLRDYGV